MKGLRIRRSLILSVCMFLLTAVCLCGFGASAQAAGVSASKVKKQADKIIKKQTKKISKKDKAARLERILQYADRSFAFAQRADRAFIEAARDHMLSDKNLRSAAYTMMKKRKGTCFHEAAALAYLIKRAAGCPTKMVIGQTDAFSGKKQSHAWVEAYVDGVWMVFDSNLDRTKGGAMNWFRIPADASDPRYTHYTKVWEKAV